jgi:hypothetical protein
VIPSEQRPGIEAALAKKVPLPPPGYEPETSDVDTTILIGTGTGRITFAAVLAGK